ncbi:hypothetical protein CC86DRAFT_373811 [Ophiobolus disseminans]|uniref:Uncharacterized protein n=1 Tax=Ophiobolus disseminans TaxID=1469910 RepID=A0A6A6ZK77_9PLEO|nr:hypothetical protein CC86DRAFT_373811 [Ophiobolus disseminans]
MSSPSPDSVLFTLPRELRDKVYHHLLSGLVYDIPSGSHICTIEYGQITPDRAFKELSSRMSLEKCVRIPYQAPRWLLACRQMLFEGLAQFSRQSKCTDVVYYKQYRSDPDWEIVLVQDALLLSRVREMYLAVAPVSHSEPYPQESKITCRFQVQNPDLDEDANPALGYRNVLSQARGISVEVRTRFLPMTDGKEFCLPAYERLYKKIYFFPGSTYEEAHFHILMPELPGISHGGGSERVRHLPAFARTLPKLQASLIELGKSLTATACGQGQNEEEKHWVVRDWIEHSTRTWHMTIKPACSGSSSPDTLAHGGLQYFTAPDLKRTPAIVGRYGEELVFARDHIPQAGHTSWSCKDTHETVWVEDGPVGLQSGYMRAGSARMESRFDAVFEELRREQQEIAPVTEGMGSVEPRYSPPISYGSPFVQCCLGGSFRRR